MGRKTIAYFSVFFIALFCFAGASWGEVGVTDTEIKVGTHLALTGPAAVVGKPISAGAKMYFDFINAKGGVHGRKISFVAEDDGFLPSRAKEAVKKLIHRDKVFCIVGPLQGAGIAAATPDINAAKIPVLFPMSALDSLYNPTNRYIFGWVIPYQDSSALLINYAVKELGVKRIAAVHQWGPVGDTNKKAFVKEAKRHGIQLVMNEKLKNVKMDYSGLVAKMKAEKADCVVSTPTLQWTAPLMKEIERQGWKVIRIIGMASSNPAALKYLAGTAANGAYLTMNHVPTDYNNETMATYRKVIKEYGGDKARPSMYNFIGYANAKMLCEGLEQVGRNVTREKLIDALERWKNYDSGWIGKISYGSNDHIAQEGQIPVQMVNGKGVVLYSTIKFEVN